MSILAPAPSHVKPIVLFSDADFSFWCAAQCEAEPTHDVYRPDRDSPCFEDEMYDSGYSIGLTGALVGVAVAFPHFSEAAIRAGGKSFTLGRNAGLRVHAAEAGHALGLDGKPCVRPLLISGLFDREFVAGWNAGATEKAEREREMSDYFQRLDVEHAWEMEQREIDAINREVGGWDRAGNIALI